MKINKLLNAVKHLDKVYEGVKNSIWKDEFVEEIAKRGLDTVTVTPVGCIGECAIEPIVEILQGEERTTYCRVTEEIVERIINEHIVGGKVVSDFVIGKYRL